MGVKYFRTGTMPMRSQHDAFFQIHHDSLVVTEMPCFCACGKIACFYRAALFPRLRQDSLFLPRCRRLARHDIYACTEMPFFVASRYLCLRRDAIFCCATIFMSSPRSYLLLLRDILDFTAMPSFCCTTIVSYLHKLLSISHANRAVLRRHFQHGV